jgi:transcriptional regulator with AAA-type ATPase domain/tetratricopeptide (TPR) repeat protein
MAALRTQLRHLAAFDTLGNPAVPTVLLHGETGTGKGLVARVLHDSGPRAQGPFLDVNCAAIPETMLEAELFGFEAGAFTDAKRSKPGLFEAAAGGTLFLDEIDALPLALQGKLLTAIEAKRVRRVGAVRERMVDVKVVAATQAELSVRVAEGWFRVDLYHRLAVLVLALPPLRERDADIVLLAQQFLQQYATAHQLPPKRLSRAAEKWLQGYDWPGNVRELSHLMERVTLLSPEALIEPQTLARLCLPRVPSAPPAAVAPVAPEEQSMDEPTRITRALLQTRGNVVQAARILGLSRKALRYRMQRHGLERPRTAGKGEETAGRRDVEDAVVPAPVWEQKPVAVLAIEVTWPAAHEPDVMCYEPWTAHARWEHTVLEKVQGFGGVVLQRGPSLLLVAFGLPHTLEQLPHRAVQTALSIRQMTAEGPDPGERALRPTVRQAVHWGQVLVDTGVRDTTARVLPIAETLAEPVRLLGQVEPGAILVSVPVVRLVEGWFEVQACAQPEQASAVVGLKAQPSPLALHSQRPLSQFVGRARELALLADLLGQVAEGHGQVVGVVGEPGVGKSRLLYEFRRQLGAGIPSVPAAQPVRYLEGHCLAYGSAMPYLPVLDLLRACCGIAPGDSPAALTEKVRLGLTTAGMDPDEGEPYLLLLLGVPTGTDRLDGLSSEMRRARTFATLRQLLLSSPASPPLVLAVENLHWADPTSEAFLSALIEGMAGARCLVITTYRPGYRPPWMEKSYMTQIVLHPLTAQDSRQMLQATVPTMTIPEPLVQMVLARAQGNPFFLEELVQTLTEHDVAEHVDASGVTDRSSCPPSIQLPATVQEVLAARIDCLPPEEKRLLQTAAVIGTEVPLPLLLAIAELPEAALHGDLAHLQRAEFLYETRLSPEHEYTFKHILTHEVAYSSLPQQRRQVLHAHIVETLETLHAERLDEQVEHLAYHALRGEVWDKAVTYYHQAGAKAYDRAAFREAVAAFEQALQALVYLPEHGATSIVAIELRLALTETLRGEHRRGRALLGEAEALARALNDRTRLGRVLAEMARARLVTGDLDGAMAAGQEALELAAALDDRALQCHASHRLGQACYGIGAHGRAAELLRSSVEAADQGAGTPSITARIDARAMLVLTLSDLGAFAEGRRYGEETLRLATREGRGETPANIRSRLGRLYLAQGDLAHAIEVLEQGLAICRATGDWDLLRPTVASLGYAYALQGHLDEGLALLEEGIREGMRRGEVGNHTRWVAWLSDVYRLMGRSEEAWQQARQALDWARQLKNRGDEVLALYQLGAVYAHAHPPDAEQAETYYQQALALAEELGMRPLQAHCHRGLGTLYATTHQREQARLALTTAIDLYRAMDMTFWLPQTEEALAQTESQREECLEALPPGPA